MPNAMPNPEKDQALLNAAEAGNPALVGRLLAEGLASPMAAAADNSGQTALEKAIWGGHAQCAELLLPVSFIDHVDGHGNTALIAACAMAREDLVSAVLRHNANPNLAAASNGVSPLVVCASAGSAPCAQALLDAGADARIATPKGCTPLMAAAYCKSIDCLRIFLPLSDALAVDSQGLNALMHIFQTDKPSERPEVSLDCVRLLAPFSNVAGFRSATTKRNALEDALAMGYGDCADFLAFLAPRVVVEEAVLPYLMMGASRQFLLPSWFASVEAETLMAEVLGAASGGRNSARGTEDSRTPTPGASERKPPFRL